MTYKLNTIHAALLLMACSSGWAEDGRIYGTVKTNDNVSITGALRWDDEEVFWTDHFNGAKQNADRPVAAERGGTRVDPGSSTRASTGFQRNYD